MAKGEMIEGLPAGQYLDSTYHPARPQFDIKAEALAGLGDNHRSFVGRRIRYGSIEMIVDSASDLGGGWWRFRLIPLAGNA